MLGRHELNEYESFVSGETAQVIARDDRSSGIVFLERGQADSVRQIAIEHYSCPVPGCTAPRPLSTRGQSKRDHFFHRTPHAHPGGQESLDHLQAKHLLADWARRSTDDGTDVAVNGEEWSARPLRRPDVMVTWPDGRRVAIEVAYKSFPHAAWRAKEDIYRAAGIVPVWLFGHAQGRYLRPEVRSEVAHHRDAPGWRLVPLTEAVAAAGHPVLFVNPVEERIGTLWSPGTRLEAARRDPGWWQEQRLPVGEFQAPAPRRELTFELALCELAECTLDPVAGLQTPMLAAINAERQRVADAAREDRTGEEERRLELQRAAAAQVQRRLQHQRLQRQPDEVQVERRRALMDAVYTDARRTAGRQSQLEPAGPGSGPATGTGEKPLQPGRLACSRCGRPLDPLLAASGRHILC